MMAPYARLSTSVTPNCKVKPTDAIASTAAVTRPNPSEARKTVTSGPPGVAGDRLARSGWSSGQGPQLCRRQVPDHVHLARWAGGVDLEDPGRVVEAVEVGRPAGSFVPDRRARLERAGARGERAAHGGTGNAVSDLDDVRPVHARAGALRHDHGQRGQVHPVAEAHAPRRAQVGGAVTG